MTTNEAEATPDLTALQRLPETDSSPDDEAEEPTCLTTGVLSEPDEESATADSDPQDQPAPDDD